MLLLKLDIAFLSPWISVSSEISDLRNFWLHAMGTCTEKYSTYQIPR